MPIERELKYVLRNDDAILQDLRELAKDGNVCCYVIDQGYLNKGARVRMHREVIIEGIPSKQGLAPYVFTYKHPISNGNGDLELEFPIPREDYAVALHEATNKVWKIRIEVAMDNGLKWEIDRFIYGSDNLCYLVMAEIEIPQDHKGDVLLHPIIEKYLLHAVPEGDKSFNNRKLGDREYVAKVLRKVSSATSL